MDESTYAQLVSADCDLMRDALAEQSLSSATRAMRSLVSHLSPRDSLDAISRVLVCAGKIFTDQEPSLGWTIRLASALPTLDERSVLIHLGADHFHRLHYYSAITQLVRSVEMGLYAVQQVRAGQKGVDE